MSFVKKPRAPMFSLSLSLESEKLTQLEVLSRTHAELEAVFKCAAADGAVASSGVFFPLSLVTSKKREKKTVFPLIFSSGEKTSGSL